MLSKMRRINPDAVAVLSVFVATVLTQLLYPLLTSISFTFFYAAIAITAWFGGTKPGLLAIFLSLLSSAYFFLPPVYSLAIATSDKLMQLSVIAFVSCMINYLISELRNARYQIQQLSDRRLRESEEQLRLAMQAAKMGTWNWNLVTGEITWSPEHEQLLGLAPGTFDGRYETFDTHLHPDDREGLNQAVQTAIQGHGIYKHEYRIIWADGSIHWVEGRGQSFYDKTGKPVRMTGTLMNVDDRKRLEIALKQNEQQFRAIFEAEPECVKVVTADGVLQNMNPAGLAMIEADSLEQVLGECVCPLIKPSHQQAFLEFTQQAAKGKTATLEFEITGLKGTQRWLESHAVPLQTPNEAGYLVLAVTRDVTERKQAEAEVKQLYAELEQRVTERTAELHRTNNLLGSFFNAASSAAIGLCIYDKNLRFIQINEALAAINGHSVEAHLGKTIAELLPELAPIVNPLIQQVLTTGQPILNLEIAARVPSTSGTIRYCLASYFPILESNGGTKIGGVGGIVIEISDRKQAEEALTKELMQSKALFKASFDGIVVLNQQGYAIDASESFARMLGYSLEETLTLHVADWDAQWTKEELIQIAQTAELVDTSFETLHRRKDGGLYEVEITVSEVKLGDEVLQLCICRDISDRKRAEAILVEADRRWCSLLDNVQLIVVGLDQNGNIEYINPFFLQLTGYTEKEVLGKYWFNQFLPNSQKSSVQVCFQEVLENDFHPHYKNSIVTKLGEERMIAWSNTLLQNAEGQSIGTISIGEDITERHKLERMKAEFISIVSHELRTPLTSISGALELLSTGLIQPESERGQETIAIAATEADRLTRLVNDILNLERLESGKVRLECQPWDLALLMNRAVDFMQLAANQTAITLWVEPLSVILDIDGDRILQVLTNLLSNAIKFSPNNSTIWLTAEICRKREAEIYRKTEVESQGSNEVEEDSALMSTSYILITVRDQGRGIPANKLESIFERFQQVDASDSRKRGGTGLGLAICRNIVQQHGGNIWAESVLDEGSSFYFTLPLTAED